MGVYIVPFTTFHNGVHDNVLFPSSEQKKRVKQLVEEIKEEYKNKEIEFDANEFLRVVQETRNHLKGKKR